MRRWSSGWAWPGIASGRPQRSRRVPGAGTKARRASATREGSGVTSCKPEVSGQRAARSALRGERGPKSAWGWCCWRTRTPTLPESPALCGDGDWNLNEDRVGVMVVGRLVEGDGQ